MGADRHGERSLGAQRRRVQAVYGNLLYHDSNHVLGVDADVVEYPEITMEEVTSAEENSNEQSKEDIMTNIANGAQGMLVDLFRAVAISDYVSGMTLHVPRNGLDTCQERQKR